jgi:hypothetical protein
VGLLLAIKDLNYVLNSREKIGGCAIGFTSHNPFADFVHIMVWKKIDHI